MALVKADSLNAQFVGMTHLPVVRQLGLLIGLAASIALGVSIVLWSQTPNFSVLYADLSERDAAEVVQALQQGEIAYRIDDKTGALMVPASQVRQARLHLASAGLPNSSGGMAGFELLEESQGFGTSQFVQQARYHKALEGELARTIVTMSHVQSARVHLAIPKESVFVRDRKKPSASVLVHLHPGRTLDEPQVGAIVHLVASSVPNMSPEQVTIVDQRGEMLTRKDISREMALTASQFDYTRKVESAYIERIESILAPIVGHGGLRAQVTADIDFTLSEQTQESFNPQQSALRSEQSVEERSTGAIDGGVPGALSNQPPGEGVAPEQVAIVEGEGAQLAPASGPSRSTKRATRNFELDKTISHTRKPSGSVLRLSVAVVVDDRKEVDARGQVTTTPRTAEELEQITNLVKDAVGFDAERGDAVNVISAAFATPEPVAPLPEPPLWEQPWLWDVAKQVSGVLVALVLALVVLRPVMRSLAKVPPARAVLPAGQGAGQLSEDQLTLGGGDVPRLPSGASYENNLNAARGMVGQDSRLVAQVVKGWVAKEV